MQGNKRVVLLIASLVVAGVALIGSARDVFGLVYRTQTQVFKTLGDRPAESITPAQPTAAKPTWLALAAPGKKDWKPAFVNVNTNYSPLKQQGKEYPVLAMANMFDAPVFNTVASKRYVMGRIRQGTVVAARVVKKSQCSDGTRSANWLQLPGNGYVCGASGHFEILDSPPTTMESPARPNAEQALPFEYGRVLEDGVMRFSRLPSKEEYELAHARHKSGQSLPSFVKERMIGDFFLAIDRTEERDGMRFVRTISGEYVRDEMLQRRNPSGFFGEQLSEQESLPIAFVFGEDSSPLFCANDTQTEVEPCGEAQKHVRFAVHGQLKIGSDTYVQMEGDRLVRRDNVRIAQAIPRPGGVGPTDKWIHINLAQQTLVAYEGALPVYATLVTTGKETHKTPTGLYRTQRKYMSKTMRGYDPTDGIYHVEEVPWTMFYHGGYAVHGAYWHNDFGKVRSHGCTNLSAADSRWLYHWDTIKMPPSWQALSGQKGVKVYYTDTDR